MTLTVGQIILVYGVVKAGPTAGARSTALVPIILGLVLLAMFVASSRHASPLTRWSRSRC